MIRILSAAVLLIASMGAHAITAEGVMQCVQEKQLERWEGVHSYAVVKSMFGHSLVEYYERVNVRDDKGKLHPIFRQVTPDDYDTVQVGGETMSAEEFYDQYADALEMGGNAMGEGIEQGMADAGMPPALLGAGGSDPWTSMDPRVMLGGGAQMMRSAAEHKRQQRLNPEDPAAGVNQMNEFAARAKLVGEEKTGGRRAFHLQTDGIDQVQEANGEKYEMKEMHMWIDKEWCVPLQYEVHGTVTSAKAPTRPFVLEVAFDDYRQVPESNMFEPYRQTMSMDGMMDDAQKAELAKAQAQMADMEKQLASMTPEQRKMMESMIGPQLKAVQQMSAGGGFKIESVVSEIAVNKPPSEIPVAGGSFMNMLGAGQAAAAGAQTGQMTTPAAAQPSVGGAAPAQAPVAGVTAAQQACLERQVAEAKAAQEAQQKKRGFGRLMSAVGRTASRLGGTFARDMNETTRAIYDANATAEDLSAAAKDLGLTEEQVESCRYAQ